MNMMALDEWIKNYGVFLNPILEPIRMSYSYPNTIDDMRELYSNVFFATPRKMSSRLFNALVENFYVNSGRVIDKEEKLEISDFKNCSGGSGNLDNSRFVKVVNGVHLVSNWAGTNYWHWIISSLSRLSLLEDVPQDSIYLVNSLKNEFVVGSLLAIGIDPKKCVQIDRVGCVFCQNLFLPSTMGDFDKKGLFFLREKIKSNVTSSANSPKRVYISRKGRRVVINEVEVMNLLNKLGFILVRCEDLSFEDQVKMFSNAEIVIAPHGAGLTNLLFAKDNAKVLELRSPNYFGRCYYYLSNHLGFQYYSLCGEGKLPKTKEEIPQNSLYDNIKINLPRLQQALDFMDAK